MADATRPQLPSQHIGRPEALALGARKMSATSTACKQCVNGLRSCRGLRLRAWPVRNRGYPAARSHAAMIACSIGIALALAKPRATRQRAHTPRYTAATHPPSGFARICVASFAVSRVVCAIIVPRAMARRTETSRPPSYHTTHEALRPQCVGRAHAVMKTTIGPLDIAPPLHTRIYEAQLHMGTPRHHGGLATRMGFFFW